MVPTLLFVSAGLYGCGGGGGTGSPASTFPESVAATATPLPPTPPVPADSADAGAPFVPNYSPQLSAARNWNKSGVTVAVIPPAPDAGGKLRDVAPLARQAVDLWNNKVGQSVQLHLVNENAAADITIRWSDFSDLSANAIGLTEVTFRGSDEVLVTAKVRIEESLPDSYQVQVIAHELGHALGIDGHSPSESDLMYTNAHLPAAVTTRDQNTVLLSYQNTRSQGRSQNPKDTAKGGPSVGGTKTIVQYLCGSRPLPAISATAGEGTN